MASQNTADVTWTVIQVYGIKQCTGNQVITDADSSKVESLKDRVSSLLEVSDWQNCTPEIDCPPGEMGLKVFHLKDLINRDPISTAKERCIKEVQELVSCFNVEFGEIIWRLVVLGVPSVEDPTKRSPPPSKEELIQSGIPAPVAAPLVDTIATFISPGVDSVPVLTRRPIRPVDGTRSRFGDGLMEIPMERGLPPPKKLCPLDEALLRLAPSLYPRHILEGIIEESKKALLDKSKPTDSATQREYIRALYIYSYQLLDPDDNQKSHPTLNQLYYVLNLSRRTGENADVCNPLLACIDEALQSRPAGKQNNETITQVYRGVHRKFSGTEYERNRVVVWPALSSASSCSNVAANFSDGTGTLFLIFPSKGSNLTACDIIDYSKYPEEKEMLFPMNSVFKVLSHTIRGNVIHRDCDVIQLEDITHSARSSPLARHPSELWNRAVVACGPSETTITRFFNEDEVERMPPSPSLEEAVHQGEIQKIVDTIAKLSDKGKVDVFNCIEQTDITEESYQFHFGITRALKLLNNKNIPIRTIHAASRARLEWQSVLSHYGTVVEALLGGDGQWLWVVQAGKDAVVERCDEDGMDEILGALKGIKDLAICVLHCEDQKDVKDVNDVYPDAPREKLCHVKFPELPFLERVLEHVDDYAKVRLDSRLSWMRGWVWSLDDSIVPRVQFANQASDRLTRILAPAILDDIRRQGAKRIDVAKWFHDFVGLGQVIRGTANRCGATLEEGHPLKSIESVVGKAKRWLVSQGTRFGHLITYSPSISRALDSVHDVLRFTVTLPPLQYVDGLQHVVHHLLEELRNRMVRGTPLTVQTSLWSWWSRTSPTYLAVHCSFEVSCNDVHTQFEIQFHTPTTLAKRAETFPLYRALQEMEPGDKEELSTFQKMQRVWGEGVVWPHGVDELGETRRDQEWVKGCTKINIPTYILLSQIQAIQQFQRRWEERAPLDVEGFGGVSGRLLRTAPGQGEIHLLNAADDREMVWMFGPEWLVQMHRAWCDGTLRQHVWMALAKDDAWLTKRVEEGWGFYLLLLPIAHASLATRRAVINSAKYLYPEVRKLLEKHEKELVKGALEPTGGFDKSYRTMTTRKLLEKQSPTGMDLRKWMQWVLSVGDFPECGFACNQHDKKSTRFYITENVPLPNGAATIRMDLAEPVLSPP